MPQDISQLEIHPFADEHIGDEYCDIKRLLAIIDYVKNTPNAYCILNGDIVDNATKTSIGDTYTQEFNPMEQLQKAVEMLSPIKDKILCITHGNHENRTYKKEGINLSYLIAAQLGLQDRYTHTEVTKLNFIQVKLQNGRTALINLSTVTCIMQDSNGMGTVYFDGEEHLNLNERYDDLKSTIEIVQRRNGR